MAATVKTRLVALGYEWIRPPRHRYGVGLRWRCLTHDNGSTHMIVVAFINPTDGGDPIVPPPGALMVWQYGGTPHVFTFVTASGREWLDFGECGRLRVIDGVVERVT